MKMKLTLTLLLSLVAILGFSQRPDFGIYGYATLDGGTTGGAGGSIVYPTTLSELKAYAENDTPYIIMLDREFKGPGVLRLGSNKSLIGVGTSGFINQICVNIQCKHNIIIRNIKFTMTGVPLDNNGENKIIGTNTDPDCIAIQADDDNLPQAERVSHHIWIDHCEFYNEDPLVMTDKDRYDGLCDMKNDCQYITISWNYFHDHHKTCLIGKGDSDNFDRTVTYHHNRYENILSRIPLVRYSYIHFYNNFVDACDNGMNARINSNNYVDYNYYKDTKKPIFGKLAENGRVHMVGNTFDNCGVLPADLKPAESFEDTDYVPPYLSTITRDAVADIPTIVTAWSGIGKLVEEKIETYTLTISGTIHGTVTPQTSKYSENSVASVSATAESGYRFTGWTGDASGTENPLHITMNSDKTVGALFEMVAPVTVSFSISGAGQGLIETNIDAPYYEGDQISATAHHYIGSEFTGWAGTTTATENSIAISVTGDASYTATFAIISGATIYEFEDGTYEATYAVFEESHLGYSGTGYVNTVNGSDNWTELTVYAPAPGEYSCSVNHAAVSDRSVSVRVNGTSATQVEFPSSTSWDIWIKTDFKLNLVEGKNSIRFIANMVDGCPNLDRLEILPIVKDPTVQKIEVTQGWNLVSFYVQADNMYFANVLAGTPVTLMKTNNDFWSAIIPQYLNSLHSIEVGQGYLLWSDADAEISISGTVPAGLSIPTVVQSGWQLIGATDQTVDIDALQFSFDVIKTMDGYNKFGQPQPSISTIEPGKAYFVLGL